MNRGIAQVIAALALATVVACQNSTVFSGALQPSGVVPSATNNGQFGIFIASFANNQLSYNLMHNVQNPTAILIRNGSTTDSNGTILYTFPTTTANVLLTGIASFIPSGFFYSNQVYIEVYNSTIDQPGVIRSTIIYSPYPVTFLGRLLADGNSNPAAGLFIGSNTGLNVGLQVIHNATGVTSATVNSPKSCSTNVGPVLAQLSTANAVSNSFTVNSAQDITYLNQNRGYVLVNAPAGNLKGSIVYWQFFTSFNPACVDIPTPTPTSTPRNTPTPSPTSSSSAVAPSLAFIIFVTLLVFFF